MIAKLFIVAIRNMRRQLRRTILTALSFAVAVFLFTVLVAVPVSMDRIAADAAKGLRLIVIPHNSYKLPAKYCNDIRKMPHVMGCAPELQWGAIYRDPRNQIMAIGVTQDIYSVSGPSDYQLPPEIRKQMFTDRRNASVGSVLMREQGLKLGQPFTLRSPENAKLTLTLIPKAEMPTLLTARALFFDRRLLDEAVKNAYGADIQDRATFLAVRVDRAENMDSVICEIDENFHNSDGETETTPESDALNSVHHRNRRRADDHVQHMYRRAVDGVADRGQLDGDDGARPDNRGRGDARARLRPRSRRSAAADRSDSDRSERSDRRSGGGAVVLPRRHLARARSREDLDTWRSHRTLLHWRFSSRSG